MKAEVPACGVKVGRITPLGARQSKSGSQADHSVVLAMRDALSVRCTPGDAASVDVRSGIHGAIEIDLSRSRDGVAVLLAVPARKDSKRPTPLQLALDWAATTRAKRKPKAEIVLKTEDRQDPIAGPLPFSGERNVWRMSLAAPAGSFWVGITLPPCDATVRIFAFDAARGRQPVKLAPGIKPGERPKNRFLSLLGPALPGLPTGNDLEALLYRRKGRRADKWQHYLAVYDRFFAPFRDKAPRLLEIGVNDGGSLALWRKYFGPAATIVGLDIDETCREVGDGIARVVIGDQTDAALLRQIVAEMGGVDIVIDDGSHVAAHQRASLDVLFPLLAEGGLYVCEDLHTSYWTGFGGGYRDPNGFIELVKDTIDQLHEWYHPERPGPDATRREVKGIHIFDSIVVFEKARIERPFRVLSGTPRTAFEASPTDAILAAGRKELGPYLKQVGDLLAGTETASADPALDDAVARWLRAMLKAMEARQRENDSGMPPEQ
jgi:hypothetical protein